MHDSSSFLTLTYRPADLPAYGSLVPEHLQSFIKALRKKLDPVRVRFFACGEYGEKLSRPHYHVLLYGYDFPDKYHWRLSPKGEQLYRSPLLEEVWTKGHSEIGEVNFKTAAYVARYITKKIHGEQAVMHYANIELETGELLGERLPEFIRMSLRPGIGEAWFQKFWEDVFPNDYCHVNGRKFGVPRYYDKLLERISPELLEEVKEARRIAMEERAEDFTPERLEAREKVKKAQAGMLKRGYEDGS